MTLFAATTCLVAVSPAMDDAQALQALLDMPATPSQAAALADQGLTVAEIAAQLGMSQADAAAAMPPITPAQLHRLEHVALARGIGVGDNLPHVQALQFVLSNKKPEAWGRQAQAGAGTIRVVIDGDWRIRDRQAAIEGEVIPSLASPVQT